MTGFIDGEGCWHISISKNKKLKLGWRFNFFSIGLHLKDKSILEKVKYFFTAGSITKQGNKLIQLRINSQKELGVVIDHVYKFNLKTEKSADFQLFKQAFDLMELKEHLTDDGLRKIVAIKAYMNLDLSEELNKAFPYIVRRLDL